MKIYPHKRARIVAGICSTLILFGITFSPNFVLAQATPAAQAPQGQDKEKEKEKGGPDCAPVGSWLVPGADRVPADEVIARAASRSVVLLGETHDNPEHHRWQLQTLAALHAARPDMVIGFEMFPRRVQKALDQWVAGDLTEAQFLAASDWNAVWSSDVNFYLPMFHFARINRIPMVALNIDTRLRRAVSTRGFSGVPEDEREGVLPPAVPSTAYLDYLLPIFGEHGHAGGGKKGGGGRNDPAFRRFVESQQLWDRAMAQAIHSAMDRPERPLVVGIMGSGHIRYGYGVPHQLKDLGVEDVGMLLPWNSGKECEKLTSAIADAVFGLPLPLATTGESSRQRLGIRFEMAEEGGARILQVEKGSIAEKAGLRDSDVISEAAGIALRQLGDIVDIVKRQAPGTWLPLKLKRSGEAMEVIAKFPPLAG